MISENTSRYEQNGMRVNDLPQTHSEGINSSRLEGLDDREKSRLVGENYFVNEVANAPGTLDAFRDISKEGSRKEFANLYERYVHDPRNLEVENPQAYDFFRDRIFYGKEYGLNGMEKFMRDTAPRRNEERIVETAVTEALLPITKLHHGEIRNCDDPYSHGDVMKMSKQMDYIPGDTGLLPIAPDRMVACRNLMVLCGKDVTESSVETYAVDHEIVAYDPLYLKGFSQGSNDVFIPSIIRGMSGIEVYAPDLEKSGNPAESMAEMLDRGHRGMVTYNPALLNRTDAEATTPMGKLLEKFPHSANETSTLLCAVRDGNTHQVAGFMICDSKKNMAARYVEADRLMKAMDVKDGLALFTKNPYLDT